MTIGALPSPPPPLCCCLSSCPWPQSDIQIQHVPCESCVAISDWRKLTLLNWNWNWDRDRVWVWVTGLGCGLRAGACARQVRAISSQVAPISHIILSVCVCRSEGEGEGRGRQAERAHLILKGFMRHFPFILTSKRDAGQAGRGRGGAEAERQLNGRNVAHV